MRFSALGDIAMAIPPLYDACRACPDCRFIFLTRTHPARLFINPPANLTVVGIDTDLYKGAVGLRRLFASLRRQYAPDTVVDLHDVLRTKILRTFFRLSGARVAVIRKGRAEKRRLTRRGKKIMLPLKPTLERYADTFRRAQIQAMPIFRSIFDTVPPDTALYSSVAPQPKNGGRWVAIAPFARHKGKVYPEELMRQVAERIAAVPGVRVFLFGAGEREKEILARWADGHDNMVSMAGASLGLAAELALLASCDVMVSMDSANMHLASLAGVPVVSVWGATHPYAGFMGFGQSLDNAVQLDMICRPCSVFGDRPCMRGDYHCMRGISPALIAGKVERLLEASQTPSPNIC